MKKEKRTSIYKPLLFLFPMLIFTQCGVKKTADITPNSPPNLVLILVDDMGYGDVGFNGCKDIPTPNIDRIAKQGVTFTNGYVSYAVCGPSRAGLITGRYQDRFGFGRNPLFAPNDPNMGLPLSEETLASVLKQADYKSVAIGKWHLGAHPSQRPLKRGFDDFFGFLTGGHRYFPEEWTLPDEYAVKSQYDAYRTKLLRNDQRIEEKEYLTDALSREAVQYIKQYKDNPFFIYLAYNAPHGPLQATDKYLQRFDHIKDKKRKTYAAMVSAVDDGVGQVLNELEALKLSKNTLVVFLSDNGGPEKSNGSDNGPLRGQKGDLTEGGIRVPFAMKWPGTIPAGMVYDQPIISLDIFATIVAQNKGKIQLEKPLDGVNLLPYLTSKTEEEPHTQLFWRKYDQQHWAVRRGADKLLFQAKSKEFFNLGNDIGEQQNLINEQKESVLQLEQSHEKWDRQMMDPIFLGLNEDKEYNRLHPDRFERKNKNIKQQN
jgi:arylsulfatase A-like enzyme